MGLHLRFQVFFLALICLQFWTVSCTSIDKPITSEAALKSALSKDDFASVGVTLSHYGAGLKPEWDFFIVLKERNSAHKHIFQMRMDKPVQTDRGEKAPFLFAVPPGRYDIDQAYFIAPDRTGSGLKLTDRKLPVGLPPELPSLNIAKKTFTHLGEVRVESRQSPNPGGAPKVELAVTYVPYAPANATVWAIFADHLIPLKVFNLDTSKDGKLTVVPSRITFEQTTEANADALAVGFESLTGVVALLSQADGFAFFEDAQGKVTRVKAKPLGAHFLFTLAAENTKFVKFRGVCLDVPSASGKKLIDCAVESARQVTNAVQNKVPLLPQVVRWIGFLKVGTNSGQVDILLSYLLPRDALPLLQAEFPKSVFRSFVLGEALREKEPGQFEYLNEKKEKTSAWEPISRKYIIKLQPILGQCVNRLWREDPFSQTAFTLWFSPRSGGRLELNPEQSRGFVGPAYQILKDCLEPELATWAEASQGAIGRGFGIIFE